MQNPFYHKKKKKKMQNPNSQKFDLFLDEPIDLFLDEPIKQKEEIKINTLAFHATRPNSRGRVDCRWGIQVPLDVIFSPANNFNIQQMQFALFFSFFFFNKKITTLPLNWVIFCTISLYANFSWTYDFKFNKKIILYKRSYSFLISETTAGYSNPGKRNNMNFSRIGWNINKHSSLPLVKLKRLHSSIILSMFSLLEHLH